MTKTNAQLSDEIKKLKNELECMHKVVDEQSVTIKECAEKREALEKTIIRKSAIIADLIQQHSKYCNKPPEMVIVGILEEMQIPEQVSILKQITAKKLMQWRETADKHRRSAKWFENNIGDMESALVRAAKGDITTLP